MGFRAVVARLVWGVVDAVMHGVKVEQVGAVLCWTDTKGRVREIHDERGADTMPGAESAPRHLSRGDFLKVAGTAGLGSALGANVAVGEVLARGPGRGPRPQDLTFSVAEQYRPFDLLAKNFVRLRDRFDGDTTRDYRVLAGPPERRAGRVRGGGGTLRIGSDRPHFTLFRSKTGQKAPYATVILDVARLAGSGEGPEDSVFAGLVKDANNYVVAFYNDRQKVVGIDVVRDGRVNGLGSVEADIRAPFRLAFVLNENAVTALVDEGDGFRPLLRRSTRDFIDMRSPAVLAEYNNGFGTRANPGGTIALEGVEAGYYGEAGLRDPHVVTYADGTPYIRGGKLYMTFTNAGLAFFETAHWGVWRLDLESYELEQVGNLFFQRDGGDAVLGDHAGHIVYDPDRKRWIVAMSTWGDFDFQSVEINYVTLPAKTNPLKGVHVLRTRRLPLPLDQLSTPAVGQWDPHLVRIKGRWYVAFVNARRFFEFFPALARSPKRADFTDLDLVGADTAKVETEGTVMQKIGDKWYVLASNGDASPEEIRGRYPVYDLTMNQLGVLDAPHPTNIPWPMITPVPLGGRRTRYILTTFNGTQYYEPVLGYGTHGDFFVMEAAETRRGYEFAPR